MTAVRLSYHPTLSRIGEVVDLPPDQARILVQQGRARYVTGGVIPPEAGATAGRPPALGVDGADGPTSPESRRARQPKPDQPPAE